jgi:prophage regulatory protein
MSSMPEGIEGWVPSDRLLTFQQLSDKVGMKRTAIYAAIGAGTFPVPVKIGKLSRWAESEVDAWIENLKRQRMAA